MRTLIILRGPAHSGRTSFVRNAGLQAWHVDQHLVEALYGETTLDASGVLSWDRQQRGTIRETLMGILREKFSRGSLVLFEPADTGAPAGRKVVSVCDRLIEHVIQEARAWRYRVMVLDFCEALNRAEIARRCEEATRSHLHGADAEDVLRSRSHMRGRSGLAGLAGVEWISARDLGIPRQADIAGRRLLDMIEPAVADFSSYRNVVAIGDIHGCHETLRYLIGPDGCRPDTGYVFLGDYINKGPASARVLRMLRREFAGKPNVLMLSGNHEDVLEQWVNGGEPQKKSFHSTCLPSFEADGYTRAEARKFLSHLTDAVRIRWGETTFLATHGGFTLPPRRLSLLPSRHLHSGVEHSKFDVDAAWSEGVASGAIPESLIQLHGHRNGPRHPIEAGPGSFNLEGGVEVGGCMRAVVFRRDERGSIHATPLEVRSLDWKGGSGPCDSSESEDADSDMALRAS